MQHHKDLLLIRPHLFRNLRLIQGKHSQANQQISKDLQQSHGTRISAALPADEAADSSNQQCHC